MARKRKSLDTVSGRSVRPGDVLDMAVGPSLVLKVSDDHGGQKCIVCHPDGGGTRVLWFWPKESVRLLRRDRVALDRCLAAIAERKEAARNEAA